MRSSVPSLRALLSRSTLVPYPHALALPTLRTFSTVFPSLQPRLAGHAGYAPNVHQRGFHSSGAGVGRKLKNVLTTLDPARLTTSDYVDLSNMPAWEARAAQLPGEPVQMLNIVYRWLEGTAKARVPFPDGTRGFLYYSPPSPSQPLAGEIRFRITNDSDPASFAEGHDLVHDIEQLPWNIPAVAVLRSKAKGTGKSGYHGLTALLLRDGSVSETTKEGCMEGRFPILKESRLYKRLGDPFYMQFHHERRLLLTVGDQVQRVKVGFSSQAIDAPNRVSYPYKGSAIATLEKFITPTKHTGAVIRIMRIIDPVEENLEFLDHGLAPPQEGELLMRSGRPVLRLIDPAPDTPAWALLKDDVDNKNSSPSTERATAT